MHYKGIKVAFIHHVIQGGGSERVSLITAQRFSQWGIESHFITNKYNDKEFLLSQDINAKVVLLPDRENFYSDQNKSFLQTYIEQENIKIMFLIYVYTPFFYDFSPQNGCKKIFWLHTKPFGEIIEQQEQGYIAAKYSIKRWIQWYLLGKKNYYYSIDFKQSIIDRYKNDIHFMDKYIVLCPEYKEELSETLLLSSTDCNKLIPITNTIDITPAPILDRKTKTIAVVGRVSLIQKRFERMMEIWKRVYKLLPDWTLKFYGGGSDEWILKKMINKDPSGRVFFAGYETNLEKIYSEARIVCLTSSFEGWPLVLAEAQNYGTIPFAFNSCKGIEDIVLMKNGEYAGVLIPPCSIEAYAEKLIELCLSENLQKELQEKCLIKKFEYAHDVNDHIWECLLKDMLQ